MNAWLRLALALFALALAPALSAKDALGAEETGRLLQYERIAAAGLPDQRLTIWLPPGSDAGARRYPVLYMHDAAGHSGAGLNYVVSRPHSRRRNARTASPDPGCRRISPKWRPIMASYDNDISLLNSLIATTFDSVEGYRETAKDAEDPQLKANFGECATEPTEVVAMLRDEVRTLGGTPEDDGTVLGGALCLCPTTS